MDGCDKTQDLIVFRPADTKLLAGAFILGVLFVWLFYGKQPGISIPLFVIAFYVLLLAYTRPVLKRESKFGWFLSVPVLMLSLTYFFFGNEVLIILNILALPVLILLQTLLITGVNSYKWHSHAIIIDLIFGIFFRCTVHIMKPFKLLSRLLHRKSDDSGERSKSLGIRILTGLLLSVPLVIILLALLSSADMVFGRLVEMLPNFFERFNLGNFFGKALVALIIFTISFSYIWSVGHGEKCAEGVLGESKPVTPEQKHRLDPVTIITVTIAVDILYLIFVIIQFAYLFVQSGLPEGLTYSEYARNGFFELILVSLLNIGLLACTLTFTKKGSAGTEISLKVLNTIMIGCTFVMLFSAHYRMSLYENAYGFTFLRVMTHAFMIFLLVLFVITLARVWIDRLPLLKPYIAVAAAAFTIINYINVDALIAKNNLLRYYNTNVIDMNYFWSLSNDAVEELVILAGDKNADVAAEAVKQLNARKDRLMQKKDWQSFNLSDYRADRLMEKGW
jgi:hypothetical protein